MIPGEIIYADDPVVFAGNQQLTSLEVENTGDRPIQVGSHFHFAEANPSLLFDRLSARGQRLAVPAGTSVRFEPGVAVRVQLVLFGGARIVAGFRGEVGGPIDA